MEEDSFVKAIYVNQEDSIKIEFGSDRINSLYSELNQVLMKKINTNPIFDQSKTVTLCTTNNCNQPITIFFEDNVMMINEEVYEIYNFHNLLNFVETESASYCKVNYFDRIYELYNIEENSREIMDILKYNIKQIEINTSEKQYNMNQDEIYDFIYFISKLRYDRITIEETRIFNYQIIISLHDERKLIFDFNGTIYFISENESCYKYQLRLQKDIDSFNVKINKYITGN